MFVLLVPMQHIVKPMHVFPASYAKTHKTTAFCSLILCKTQQRQCYSIGFYAEHIKTNVLFSMEFDATHGEANAV